MSAFFPVGRLLILPSRLAVDRERLRLLDASAGFVVLAPRVYHFGRLESELSRQLLKDPASARLSDLARDMVLENLLEARGEELGWPSSRGVRQSLADLINQVKSAGQGPAEFEDFAGDAVSPSKLKGFIDIFTAYQDFLREKGLMDRADRRGELISVMKSGRAPRLLAEVREIVIRDFARFTPFQLELINVLSRMVDRVEIHLVCPQWLHEFDEERNEAGKGNPFKELLTTVRTLEATWHDAPGIELVFESPEEKGRPALNRLRHLFRPTLREETATDPGDGIEIVAAPGRYAEVEHIGRRIWQLIDRGIEPDRIALAVRDLGEYGQLVEDVFRRFRLPLFFRRGAPLNIQAPARALLALMRLATSRWNIDLVLDVLASPYLDTGLSIPWTEAARLSLEAGVSDERAGGGWVRNLERLALTKNTVEKEKIRAVLDCIEYLKDRLKPLAGARSWPEFGRVTAEVLKELDLKPRILTGAGPDMHRDASALAALEVCLAELAQSSKQTGLETRLSPGDLLQGLSSAMDGRNIGRNGDSQGGIMVLSAFDLHGLSFDYLFLAGLNEGEFPKTRNTASLLDDAEINGINEAASKRLLKSSSADYREEELLFYQSAGAAGKHLFLSYSRMDEEGRVRLPSALVDEVTRLWPEGALEILEPPPRVLPTVDEIMTREEMLSFLSANLLGRNPSHRSLAAGLLSELDTLDPDLAGRYRRMEIRVLVERLREENRGGHFNTVLRPQSLALWEDHLKQNGRLLLSPTFFQDFGNCPFIFWAKNVIRTIVPQEPIDELNIMDEGSILHEILKEFMHHCQKAGLLPLNGRPEEAELLRKITIQVWERAETGYPLGRRPLWIVRRRFLERVLADWLKFEQDRNDDFIPRYFEWAFGLKNDVPPMEAPLLSGGSIYFKGRIDRIDEGPETLRVLDYKNSGNYNYYSMLKQDELGRTSYQAPLYQAAVSQAFKKPVTAGWVLLRDFKGRKKALTPPSDADFFNRDIEVREEMAREGIENFYNRLEDSWLKIKSGILSPSPKKGQCDYCDFQTICRYQKMETSG